MDKKLRKEALTEYRERKVYPGIFALHCDPAGQVWVGKAPDLATIENRMRFMLSSGSVAQPEFKSAIEAYGADAFRFEELESLEPDLSPMARDTELKSRLAHWAEKLGARTF
ncbi:MAG: GIY-YIG nuclease family protein [Hyphomicrobiaceae bacterium]|nr:GIY-YIG nuclease family protein [Hyphomicrobiaceae bacterium]